MEITPATVPGIGTVHQCRTRHGHRLAVVQHHDGRRDLIIYPPTATPTCAIPTDATPGGTTPAGGGGARAGRIPDDREDVGLTVVLDVDEADQLAGLLLSRTVADRLTAVERRLAQLTGR